MGYYNVRQDWKAILFYAVVTFGITQVIYLVSKHMYGEEASIHIEVLLPAFVVGMIMRHKHIDTKIEHQGVRFYLLSLYVPCRSEHAGVYGRGFRSASGGSNYGDRFPADDVMVDDRFTRRNRLILIQYR